MQLGDTMIQGLTERFDTLTVSPLQKTPQTGRSKKHKAGAYSRGTPYTLIYSIFSHSAPQFIGNLVKEFEGCDTKMSVLTTSCLNTSYAITTILLGVDQAEIFRKRISAVYTYNYRVPLSENLGDYLIYEIGDIFGGEVTCRINKLKNFELLTEKKQEERSIQIMNALFQEKVLPDIQPFIDQCFQSSTIKEDVNRLEEKLENLQYGFNSLVIKKLKKEICKNNASIKAHKSFMYWVGITDGAKGFIHSFVLEQFQSTITNRGRIRLYQSWVEKATLIEDINKRGYTENDSGTWDLEETKQFLNSLEQLYDHRKTNDATPCCFGYGHVPGKIVQLDRERGILSSKSIRYASATFGKCQKNLQQFSKILQK